MSRAIPAFVGVMFVVAASSLFVGCGDGDSGVDGARAAASAASTGTLAAAAPSSGQPPAATRPHFADARRLAAFLNGHIEERCAPFTQVIAPGKAVHPVDQGATAESLGVSEAIFDMNNRIVEFGGCAISGDSNLSIERFAAQGLSVPQYQARLETSILRDACSAFSDTESIIDVIWRDGPSMWNLESSSRDYEEIKALSPGARASLAAELAGLLSGTVVKRDC